MFSTNASGAITGWKIDVSDLVHHVAGNEIGMVNPTIMGGGTGLPLADGLVYNGGGNGGIGPPGPGYNLGNSVPGSWTESLNGFQGGSTSSPVFLLGGNPIGRVTGTISGQGSEDYYSFNWGGGAFSASAPISGAPTGASYLFSAGVAGTCNSLASETLNGADNFSSMISLGNLAPGQYCIGLDANSPFDPNYSLIFNTPVSGLPEPGSIFLLGSGIVALVVLRRKKHIV